MWTIWWTVRTSSWTIRWEKQFAWFLVYQHEEPHADSFCAILWSYPTLHCRAKFIFYCSWRFFVSVRWKRWRLRLSRSDFFKSFFRSFFFVSVASLETLSVTVVTVWFFFKFFRSFFVPGNRSFLLLLYQKYIDVSAHRYSWQRWYTSHQARYRCETRTDNLRWQGFRMLWHDACNWLSWPRFC